MKLYDDAVTEFITKHNVPGASLAVVKDGRLVYAKGLGFADRDAKIPATPDTLFRLASVSKPITGVAVMKLVEQGKLKLDQPALAILGIQPFLKDGAQLDTRLEKITVRHLLQHTAGWDRDKSGDPMFSHRQAARDLGVKAPISQADLIRWQLGKQLDSDPGQKFAYSNFGYCLLGRIIEKVTDKTYEDYVRDTILKPMGIRRMRIGKGKQEERFADEAVYYDPKDAKSRPWWRSGGAADVPTPYAFQSPELMDAHGGWVASAVDVARFAAALDVVPASAISKNGNVSTFGNVTNNGNVLKPDTMAEMFSPPAAPVSRDAEGKLASNWYGDGWSVRDVRNGKLNTWHFGAMPGTATMLIRRVDGLSWVLLLNQRAPDGAEGMGQIERELHRVGTAIKAWPQVDLFGDYR
jgi:N-acyl-D-amino-acid deacylase